MASFATEDGVRLKFQLNDSTLVSSDLVNASIDDAHTEILRYLNPVFDTETPESALVLGETALAGGHLFRSLASKDAFDQKQLTIGGQRIESGKRFGALTTLAALVEELAWRFLEPYLRDRSGGTAAGTTDSVPVLGEE